MEWRLRICRQGFWRHEKSDGEHLTGVRGPQESVPAETPEKAEQSSWEPGAVDAGGSATPSWAAGQAVGPAGIRGWGLGWQPATHRLARSGGVSGPWRGAWNTPCRKRHVTMTPQKSGAAGKQRAAWRGEGAGTEGAASPGAHAAPQHLWAASQGTGVWPFREGGSWDARAGGSQGLGICKFEAGVGQATWAAGTFTIAVLFVITLWQMTLPEL